jgi:hypothetical protein
MKIVLREFHLALGAEMASKSVATPAPQAPLSDPSNGRDALLVFVAQVGVSIVSAVLVVAPLAAPADSGCFAAQAPPWPH